MHLDHFLSITKWSNGLPPTLFMEFIDGSHLADAHRLCPIKNRELKDLLNQLLQAVAFLHQSGVTHRDIKPANVMIIRRDEIFVKLADFDLASVSTTSLEEFCGTPRYAAPEIMFGAKYNSKVDVWSLGIVGLEILHGLPNFSRKGWPNIISNHIASQNQTPILRFISKLVKKGPIERVSAQQALDDGFFEADGAANENALPGGGQQHTPWRRTASSETLPDTEPWGCLAVVPEPGCQDVSDPKTVTHIITPSRPDPAGHDRSSAGPSVSRRKRLVVSKPSSAKEHRRSAADSLSYFTEAEYHETFLAPQNRSYLQLAVVSPKNAHVPVEIPSEGLYDSSLALPWSLHQAGDDLLTAANNSKSLQGPAGGSDKYALQAEEVYTEADPVRIVHQTPEFQVTASRRPSAKDNYLANRRKAMYRPLAPAQHPPMKTPQMHNKRLVTGLAFCPTSVRQSGSDAQQQEDNGILNWNLATVGVATQKISPDSNVSRPQSETPRIQAKESHPNPQNVQNDKATNIDGGFELSPHQERPFAPRPGGLSTRDVFNDKHIFKMVVKNRAMSMRLPDYYLNATQIFQAVDLSVYRRKKLLACLQENSHINKETDGVWVPFRDGVFLCKEVKLFEEVRNLLKHADQPLPPDKENYLHRAFPNHKPSGLPAGYEVLNFGKNKTVVFRKVDGAVNATHLCAGSTTVRQALLGFFRSHPQVQVVERLQGGNSRVQGTYIALADTQIICDYFNLVNPRDQILARIHATGACRYALSGEPLYNLCEATAGNDYGIGNCTPPNAPATISGRESMTILGV
ncbi:hypothetical protein MCOR01_000458 [Pyricularia oryzae]|nr:hypothetical protein MCOR01_000458 [Pyricularia oryzae]